MTDRRADDLFRTFPHVVRLELMIPASLGWSEISFVPFCKFSPNLKSFRVDFSFLNSQKIFVIFRSFPLLEDLALCGCGLLGNYPPEPQTDAPSASPVFTGSLELMMGIGVEHATRLLLDLPNGIHFRKLTLSLGIEKVLQWTTELVIRCSDTLEYLNIRFHLSCYVFFASALELWPYFRL